MKLSLSGIIMNKEYNMLDDILEHVSEILIDFKNSNQMTYWAYSTLYDVMCLGIQQAYNSGKHDGIEQERKKDEE